MIAVKDANGNIITDYSHIAQLNPIRYRGYYYDNETGFYYLGSRYYDPAVGRFINADGLVTTGWSLMGYNMFAYCNNNPINVIDPSGYLPYGIAGGIFDPIFVGLDNMWNMAKQIFNVEQTTTYTHSEVEEELFEEPFPIQVTHGTTVTSSDTISTNTAAPLTIYADYDFNHGLKSSKVGINISGFDFGFGLDDTSISQSFSEGNTTQTVSVTINLCKGLAGLESSIAVWDKNSKTTTTTYTNVSGNITAILSIYVAVVTGTDIYQAINSVSSTKVLG